MIHTCSQTLTAISESVLLDSQNQGFLYWSIELCVEEVLQSTAQWSFLGKKEKKLVTSNHTSSTVAAILAT